MTKNWFQLANIFLSILVALTVLAAIIIQFSRTSDVKVYSATESKYTIPEHPFEQEEEAYHAIGEPFLNLSYSSPSLQLPNLQPQLIYYGRNARPDAIDNSIVYLSFGGKSPMEIAANKPIYLTMDRSQVPPKYTFSPDNAETCLWIEVSPYGNQAQIDVSMENGKGKIIKTPFQYASFMLPEKEYARAGNVTNWQIGNIRIDGTLLARQKARWFGQDKFLQEHGGEEYEHALNKQRIDFGEGEDAYSIFIDEKSCMIFEDNRWVVEAPGNKTIGKPLMCVKKIDPRLINFDLWDADGKTKISLNLLKSIDTPILPNIHKNFKFLSAKTRSQFVFDINNERFILSPQDWVLFYDNHWMKLDTEKDIDAYVSRKITGPLLILNKVERKDDRLTLFGTIFNNSRTETANIEIPLVQGSTGSTFIENDQTKQIQAQQQQQTQQSPPFPVQQQPSNAPSTSAPMQQNPATQIKQASSNQEPLAPQPKIKTPRKQ